MDWYNAVRHPAERDTTAARLAAYNLISAALPMTAPEGGQPMALSSTSATVAKPLSTPASGQPMVLESLVSSGSGQPMALLPATIGPSGSPMASLFCSPMAQGATLTSKSSSIIRLRLPASLDSQKPEVFEAVVGQKWSLPELDRVQEREIVEKLVAERNSKFHGGLDANFSMCREEDKSVTMTEEIGDTFILAGSSHAHWIAEALLAQGDMVTFLADSTWRLTEENATNLAKSLKSAVLNNPAATVILQLYDSSIYYSSTGPGERSLLH